MDDISEIIVEEPARLDKFLSIQFPDWSRTRLQKLISNQHVEVDGKIVSSHYKLKAGYKVKISWPPPLKKKFVSSSFPKPPIIFEDEFIVVVNKPPGLVVHPAVGHFDGNTLVELMIDKINPGHWPDESRTGLVHRLDRDTSGVIILAKSPEGQAALSKQFALRQTKKVYFGLVDGKPPVHEGTLESKLARHPGQRQRFAVTGSGRWALTKFKLREHWNSKASWLELAPRTGRTHQIRVQLAAYGHPILGDQVYGNRAHFSFIPRQMLHAFQLTVTHPITKKSVKFEAPPPKDFLEAIKLIRLNT